MKDEASHVEEAESGKDHEVPVLEEDKHPSPEGRAPTPEPEFKPSPLCHQRIEKLKQIDGGAGGRNSLRRKLSLQANSEAPKQDARRVSFADVKQIKHPLQDTWTFWYYMVSGNVF